MQAAFHPIAWAACERLASAQGSKQHVGTIALLGLLFEDSSKAARCNSIFSQLSKAGIEAKGHNSN